MQFAPLYPIAYQCLSPCFPQCLWLGNTQQRRIALTFDDGPHPEYTPQLLKVLAHHHVQASFFWLGRGVQCFPQVAQAVYQQGHWLGLHGFTHRNFPGLTASALKDSLSRTQQAIAHACDLPLTWVQQQVRDVRPPNGLFTPTTLARLQEWQYRPVMWTVVPEDWVEPGVTVVIDRVLRQVKNGALIVLHDGVFGGASVAETVDRLIPLLRQQQYDFVTVEVFWQGFFKGAVRYPIRPLE